MSSYGGFEYGGGGGGFDGGGGGGGGGFGSPGGGGGGFMGGGGTDSPGGGGGGGSGGGGQKNKEQQSLLSVNIKQVLESEMANQDSGAKIDGADVSQIKLVGCIVEVDEASTNTEYTVEDTTGRLKVKMFHNDGEGANDRAAEKRARCQVGTYVRVFGNVRSWKDDRHSVAYTMTPIADMDEVTLHALETIYTHLFNTKGPLPGKASMFGGAGVAQPMNGVGSPGFNGGSSQHGFTSPGNNNNNNNNMYNNSNMDAEGSKGFTPIQQKVHDQFLGADEEQGRSIAEVADSLTREGISRADVSTAVQFLSSEGHLYSTIDDDHYRSTET
ncbi:unnamed protein product [Ectocarpus sp. 4 AP-2014]